MFDPQTPGLLHYEDFILNQPLTVKGPVVTAEAIKAFARLYDPQPIHLDEEAAKTSIVGGLCASGFHTCCMMMRLLCDGYVLRTASLGGPGLDELKWLKPVRPGDVLQLRLVATEKRVMASRPSVGIVLVTYDMLNQNDETVLVSACHQMVRVRDPKPVADAGPRAAKAAPPPTIDLWDAPLADAPVSPGLYFEDRVIGETRAIGTHTFTAEEIVAFARQYDPQPFHLDDVAGKASLFGGLAASGWHTACIFIRLLVADRQGEEAKTRAAGKVVPVYGPSPGFKNLRWIKPVLAGDTLEYRHRVNGKVDLKSRPDRGMLLSVTQARNQRGELTFEQHGAILVERRQPAGKNT
jgi:acyl dehydratase